MSNKMNSIEHSGVSKNYSLGYEEDVGDWKVEVIFYSGRQEAVGGLKALIYNSVMSSKCT
jgi:hypothetical protein